MRVPLFGTRGVLKNCVFLPLCYCSDTLLDVRKPTKLGFQSLDENPPLWWLSFSCFYTWQYFNVGVTEAVLWHSVILQQVCRTSLHFLKWNRSFVSIRIWLNLWFSHFSFFQYYGKNYLIACFSWLKTKDNCLLQIVCLGGLFAWWIICKVPLFVRLASGPSVEFKMRPQNQRWFLSLLCDWSLRRAHKNLSTSK